MGETDDVMFEDAENWHSSSNKDLGKKQIVLKQYNNCIERGSKAFIGTGSEIEFSIYINSIDMLEIIFSGEIQDVKNYSDVRSKLLINEKEIKDINDKRQEIIMRLINTKEQQVNEKRLNLDFAVKLKKVYDERLKILTMIIHKLNWFDEVGIMDGR